jgi:pimeloyl-ACP methyl ester carboxylesterase
MKERVITVGKPIPLAGVLCEPDELDSSKPAVIIFNSGIMHHIGTCRLSVKLARQFAEIGYSSIRFDFSGIGDSEARLGSLSFAESAPQEAAEMMDFLQKRRGISQFVLYGLCSGADAAYETALIDNRVVAICQIDPYAYKTPVWYLIHYGSRIFRPGPWFRFFKRKLIRTVGSISIAKKNAEIDEEFIELPSYIREFPPKKEVAANLRKLLDRRVAMYAIFPRSLLNHQSQYANSMGLGGQKSLLRVDYIPEAEHIIPEPDCQKLVVSNIVNWLKNLGAVVAKD